MTTIYQFDEGYEEGQRPYQEDIEVTSVVQLPAVDRDMAIRMTSQLLIGAESLKSKGPLSIDTTHDEDRGQLNVTLARSLAAVMRLLNCKDETGARLFADSADVSAKVSIHPIHGDFATSISSHLLIAAKNHPQSDTPLRIDSKFDEDGQRLTLIFDGSNFAVSYLYSILYLRFTQRLDRTARSA